MLENESARELLDWLETQNASLINDRNGHWSVIYDALQDHPKKDKEICDIRGTFFIPSQRWSKSIRGAIKSAQKRIKDPNCPYWMLKKDK